MTEAVTIFCGKCNHLTGGGTKLGFIPYHCSAPQNGKPNFESPTGDYAVPEDINKNNDCKWFVPKRSTWKILLGIC